MSRGCFKGSVEINTRLVIVLLFVVILNNTLINGNPGPESKNDSKNEYSILWYLTVLQTYLSFIGIMLILIYRISASFIPNIISMKLRCFGLIFLTLLFESLELICYIIQPHEQRMDEIFWPMKKYSNEADGFSGLKSDYIFSSLLIFYFAFKFYTMFVTLHYIREIQNKMKIVTGNDIVQPAPREETVVPSYPDAPPSYDLCLMESAPPPNYSDICNFQITGSEESDKAYDIVI